jgi:putative acetyltransferase
MIPGLVIQPATGAEEKITALHAAAFPQEDLLPLVRALAGRPDVLALVARLGPELVGHVAFTRCGVAGRAEPVALLGPLAVAPQHQRCGIGGALVRQGLRRLAEDGVVRVQVLGDPDYYGRFGFRADAAVAPACAVPDAWRPGWQALALRDVAPPLSGVLEVPAPWREPALWAP